MVVIVSYQQHGVNCDQWIREDGNYMMLILVGNVFFKDDGNENYHQQPAVVKNCSVFFISCVFSANVEIMKLSLCLSHACYIGGGVEDETIAKLTMVMSRYCNYLGRGENVWFFSRICCQ